ncbi:tRNA (guanosine(37)-N1)-methyltransferase TrmD [Campylobacter sp. FMV-PI01]|uniref:tRNA (guanine-N(1)-)-methyltransferase n=1 Tax=Campylobacter portucalensis TaxID=2608384 RepID=A0A6L5WG41_9BACT|nr:tRNA (guanosine(37)-N1)-methyltransferase TrmD [Campylobacter portucalensis]MSN96100.1 tRNA (guanosine(37)-N1)-methyltransferase TrmD [Campylobacter portucalensis]
MKFSFITLFETLVKPYFDDSILKRAFENGLIDINFINPRDFSKNKYKKVDDYIIGGGAGLLMSVEPLSEAIKYIANQDKDTHFVFISPAGKRFKQKDAKRLAKFNHIAFICGRYEGIDERVVENYANEVFCIGDFILTGGELPALCICDAISRNIKGVLGNDKSLEIESFECGMLEAPAFTKPNIFRNSFVISEFLKGNHAKISVLKNEMAKLKTRYFRPDLYILKEKYEK